MSWVIDGASAIIHLRQKIYKKDWDRVKNYTVPSLKVPLPSRKGTENYTFPRNRRLHPYVPRVVL